DGGDIEHLSDEAFAKRYAVAGALEIPTEHDEVAAAAVISGEGPKIADPAELDPVEQDEDDEDFEDEDELLSGKPEEEEAVQTSAEPEEGPIIELWPKFEDREDGGTVSAVYA